MIYREDELIETIKTFGYCKCESHSQGEQVFWKKDDSIQKLILIEDGIYRKLYSKKLISEIKSDYCKSFHGLKKEHILLIITGDQQLKNVRFKNSIRINMADTSIYHSRVNRVFFDEYMAIKNLSKMNLLKEQQIQSLKEEFLYSNREWIVYLLIALNIYCYMNTFSSGNASYGFCADDVIKSGETYRLMTYMFMHSNIFHLVVNMFSLWAIGIYLVRRIGVIDFVITYVIGGIMGGISSILYAWNFTGITNIRTVGASGAIFALLGALSACSIMDIHKPGHAFSVIRYIILTIILSGLNTGIDNACHIGGIISGILIYLIFSLANQIYANIIYIRCAKALERS